MRERHRRKLMLSSMINRQGKTGEIPYPAPYKEYMMFILATSLSFILISITQPFNPVQLDFLTRMTISIFVGGLITYGLGRD
jgi:hypothetical protein